MKVNTGTSTDDSPSPLGRFKRTQLTGTRFRETLPLLASQGEKRHSRGTTSSNYNNALYQTTETPLMKAVMIAEEDSYLSKQEKSMTSTFADYRSNLISGSIAVGEPMIAT